MSRQMIVTARAEALFASDLSASEPHPAAELREAITTTIRRFGGVRGCAARMAEEFGEHPTQAAERMRWAHTATLPLTPHAQRVINPSLMTTPPGDGLPRAGQVRATGQPAVCGAVTQRLKARLGWDDEADRIERWVAEGQVGHWTDPEFDVPDPRLMTDGGEGGS
jgi:hypothetical protein